MKGASSLDVVESVINYMENNPYFNAGKGSSLNEHGEVEVINKINWQYNLMSIYSYMYNKAISC